MSRFPGEASRGFGEYPNDPEFEAEQAAENQGQLEYLAQLEAKEAAEADPGLLKFSRAKVNQGIEDATMVMGGGVFAKGGLWRHVVKEEGARGVVGMGNLRALVQEGFFRRAFSGSGAGTARRHAAFHAIQSRRAASLAARQDPSFRTLHTSVQRLGRREAAGGVNLGARRLSGIDKRIAGGALGAVAVGAGAAGPGGVAGRGGGFGEWASRRWTESQHQTVDFRAKVRRNLKLIGLQPERSWEEEQEHRRLGGKPVKGNWEQGVEDASLVLGGGGSTLLRPFMNSRGQFGRSVKKWAHVQYWLSPATRARLARWGVDMEGVVTEVGLRRALSQPGGRIAGGAVGLAAMGVGASQASAAGPGGGAGGDIIQWWRQRTNIDAARAGLMGSEARKAANAGRPVQDPWEQRGLLGEPAVGRYQRPDVGDPLEHVLKGVQHRRAIMSEIKDETQRGRDVFDVMDSERIIIRELERQRGGRSMTPMFRPEPVPPPGLMAVKDERLPSGTMAANLSAQKSVIAAQNKIRKEANERWIAGGMRTAQPELAAGEQGRMSRLDIGLKRLQEQESRLKWKENALEFVMPTSGARTVENFRLWIQQKAQGRLDRAAVVELGRGLRQRESGVIRASDLDPRRDDQPAVRRPAAAFMRAAERMTEAEGRFQDAKKRAAADRAWFNVEAAKENLLGAARERNAARAALEAARALPPEEAADAGAGGGGAGTAAGRRRRPRSQHLGLEEYHRHIQRGALDGDPAGGEGRLTAKDREQIELSRRMVDLLKKIEKNLGAPQAPDVPRWQQGLSVGSV